MKVEDKCQECKKIGKCGASKLGEGTQNKEN